MNREPLPSRRSGEIVEVSHFWSPSTDKEQREVMTLMIGHYPDGRIGEVFVDYSNRNNERAISLGHDIATILSIALQYGAPVDVLQAAVSRSPVNRMGKQVDMPQTPIGTILDALVRETVSGGVAPLVSEEYPLSHDTTPPKPVKTGVVAKLKGDENDITSKTQKTNRNDGRTLPAKAKAQADVQAFGSAVEPGATKLKLADKIRNVLLGHPDWTAAQISEEIGHAVHSINLAAGRAGLKIRRLTTQERSNIAFAVNEKRKSKEVAKPAPTAKPVRYEPIPRPVVKDKNPGKKYYLQDKASGKYLHADLHAMMDAALVLTDVKSYAWSGTERQLVGTRRLLPSTIELREVPVK